VTRDQDGADRFEQVVAAFAKDRKLAPIAAALLADRAKPRRGSFGLGALKVDGKMFAMLVKGRLVVKLSRDRVDELVCRGDAEYFDPGHGRLMKQWAVILRNDSSWTALAKEAHAFVEAASK
jgi:hypothetical protein